MKRLHLFEFEDQPWFPGVLRNYMTDYLRHVIALFDLFAGAIPILSGLLEGRPTKKVVDLGSGGGGPWPGIAERVAARTPGLHVTLSDLFPNTEALAAAAASDEAIGYRSEPVDATAVPVDLAGVRTQFLSLHHFRPEMATRMLGNAVLAGEPIAIFEAQERSLKHLIQFSLSPLTVLLFTPGIRPLRIGRLVFTYLIPLVPLFVFWDGVVSVLRTYSQDELLALAKEADPDGRYVWEAGAGPSGKGYMLWMTGTPKGNA